MRALENISTTELLSRAAETALSDPSCEAEGRWDLVHDLRGRCETPVFDASKTWCDSPNSLLRCLGADVLGQLGYRKSYPFGVDSAPILSRLLHDPEPKVISSALSALGHLHQGDLVAICALASHQSPTVRQSLAYCLGVRDEPLARQTLVALSRDSETHVRDWATFGLGSLSQLDTSEVREALAARLTDDDDVRLEAMRGLAARGDQRAVSVILEELKRDDVSSLAIESAADLPSSLFLPALEALLAVNPTDPDISVAIERCRKAIS
jgi:HEAT repeat protein